MPMTAQELREGAEEFTRDGLNNREGTLANITADDIRAAYNALDQWVDDNAAAVNLIIPQPFRGVASVAQKSRLLRFVLQRKYRDT